MEADGKRKLAKKLLIFVCCFIPSVIFFAYWGRQLKPAFLDALLFERAAREYSFLAWITVLFPYLLVQLIRSIVRAIKRLRSK